MKELNIDEIRELELKLLSDFDSICRKEDFRYSLGGGTLLGAIRHHGFIPWDDDIDVMMPRPDYDRFIEYCYTNRNNIPFHLISYEHDNSYYNLFAKAELTNTVLKNDSKSNYGLNIDVFPLDGLGDTYDAAVKKFNKTSFKRELLNAATWKRFTLSRTHAWYYEPIRFTLFIISRFVNIRKLLHSIDKINRQTPFDSAQYAGCVCGCYRKDEIVKKDDLAEYTELQFETKSYMAIKEYDDYLKKHYGDYMKLPPKEKRVTHHKFKVYIKDSK